MFSTEPQKKRKREDDKHLSSVLSITYNAIDRNMSHILADQNKNAAGDYLKEKEVENREETLVVNAQTEKDKILALERVRAQKEIELKRENEQLKKENEQLKKETEQLNRENENVKKLYKMTEMKIKLTKISDMKKKIESLESKLKSQQEEHQKFRKKSENVLRGVQEVLERFLRGSRSL